MKNIKIFILGASSVGKTSLIHQIVFGTLLSQSQRLPLAPVPTIEDVYFATLEPTAAAGGGGQHPPDRLLFFDVAGIKTNIDIELVKSYIAFADEFILVYSINDRTTFNLVDTVKKLIEQSRGKREHPITVLGNKVDLDHQRQVDFDEALVWAKRENTKLFEVTSYERDTLNDFVRYLSSQLAPAPVHSTSGFKLRRSKTNQSASSNS